MASQPPGTDDSIADLGLRRLEAADEAVVAASTPDAPKSPYSPSGESRSYGTGYSRGPVYMEKVHMYLIDPEASILLKEIAELMILVGHAPNICRDYGETRHHMLMQFLSLLSVQIEQKSYNNPAATTTNGACSMQLYEKNQKMWIQALKVFVSTVLPEERNSCAQIFGCDRKVEEDCFARATTRCTGQLLAVGSMMTNVKVYDQQHHKVPLLLQMHEELIKLQRSINVLLSGDAKGVISEQASMLLDKLGEEASSLLMEFLNVCSNPKPCQNIVLDGDILPLTRHVMGFVEQLTECSDTVNLILLPILEEEEEGAEITKSPWECYVRILLARLQLKFEENAESYKDERLRPGFLCHWMRKGIKNFNSAFGEITRVQTTWKVPDPQLRQHLRLIILQQVLTAYRTYLERYGCYLGNNESEYVKYTPDEIENDVLDLFEG
uniref:Exocyst subunit Exo70 family protein n=1 Tax=Aegilops tauschii TaxID=37682 RepID=R7W4P8_AEGTA